MNLQLVWFINRNTLLLGYVHIIVHIFFSSFNPTMEGAFPVHFRLTSAACHAIVKLYNV